MARVNRRGLKLLAGAVAAMAVVASLLAGNFFSPNLQPFGYIAPPAGSSRTLVSGNETLYAPWFDKSTFSGDLLAIGVAADGTPDFLNPLWQARLTLANQHWNTGRAIVTTDGAGTAIPFGWDSLTPAQRTALDPDTAADAMLVARTDSPVLNFIRGDRSNETDNGGTYRNRSSVLGDIIHSPPQYAARPSGPYAFDNYFGFSSANAARAPRVYVGANDGMLHAFDAVSGAEVFAFIPSPVIPSLDRLKSRPYLHQHYVDGPITLRDAYFDSAWHTILVGGLGAGGQGFYALDVTTAEDAASTTEAVAASKVLWEFTEGNDPNLGFTYGRPAIVRLQATGQWVAIVSNGYVNSAADAVQGDARGRLYALDIETGAKVGEIAVSHVSDSAGNPNGLSSPTAVDTDGDFKADRVYAGDIKGNLWAFDISGAPGGWNDSDATLLLEAQDGNGVPQPITTAPEVALHPADTLYPGTDLMVFVGTGRLLDQSDFDPLLVGTDSIYGVWDKPSGSSPVARAELVEQTLTEKTHANGERVRVASNNPIDWSASRGWVVDLPASGERLLTDPVLRTQRLQFTSSNPIVPSGENWLIQLTDATGGAPGQVIMDINRNKQLDPGDDVDGNGDGDTGDPEDHVVAQFQQFGLASQPLIASLGGGKQSALINHLNAISPVEFPPDPPDEGDLGLIGGHFDLDVASEIYESGGGSTDNHTHEWDDKTGLSTIDYMNIVKCGNPEACLEDPTLYRNDPSFNDIDEQITDPNRRFILVVANSSLSPGGVIEINGASLGVVPYESAVEQHVAGSRSLPVYQIGPNPPDGVQQLTSLKMSFSALAIVQGGLIGTATGCVRGNHPGFNGEYRNGALTVQAIDATTGTIDPVHHNATAGLLWESTVFWHWKGGCYGTEKWQASYDDCFVDGNVCNCIDRNDHPLLCELLEGGDPPPPPPDDGGSGDDGSGSGCTVSYTHPNPRSWLLEFDEPLCESSIIPPNEFKLEFEKNVEDDQVTTLIVVYDGGQSQSITFKPTDLFSGRTGSPLQFDLTAIEFKGKEVKRIRLRNVGSADLNIENMLVSWSGGNAAQKLKKIKQEKPNGIDFTGGLPASSTAVVPVAVTVPTSYAGACSYTLGVDYTDSAGASQRSSHTFDDGLTGISGYPLEIDLDESSLEDGGKDVVGIRIRSLLDEVVTITGVSMSWTGAPAGQALKKLKDTSDNFDMLSGGDTSASGLDIKVGGTTKVGDNCPEDGTPGDPSDPGDGSDGGGSDGTGTGADGTVTPLDTLTGFNITNTTGAGSDDRRRLLWREVVR